MLPKLTHPTIDVTIPSMKKKIRLRPMLVKEEKILLFAKESKEDIDIFTAIKQVVNNCIVTPNTNINDFTIFDLEYIFLISSTSRNTTIPFYKPRAMYRSC